MGTAVLVRRKTERGLQPAVWVGTGGLRSPCSSFTLFWLLEVTSEAETQLAVHTSRGSRQLVGISSMCLQDALVRSDMCCEEGAGRGLVSVILSF